ncbi:MAG: twin-arginine translocation pathway signal [Burkholderiales bacterium]|nr:twin-arginine translocation pathway signal [Burkholderiales bacterium]
MNPSSPDSMTRRDLLLAAAAVAAAPLAGCATTGGGDARPPIVFVHGNGDTAALWTTTIWRFESNGWPRERLFALDLPYPNARNEDAKAQPGRTSAAEYTAHLAGEVKKALAATGASKVVLIGNSRGGYPIRQFIADGGAGVVSHAVLCGVPNHGVWAHSGFLPGSEFNGLGPFLSRLNAPQGADGNEVTPGVRWLTIRSDNNDKYAQPDGVWIGQRGTPTNVTFDGPALKGAENVVIAGIDHRETAFGPKAFAEMWRFLTGQPAATTAIVPEAKVVLDGVVSGLGLDNREGGFTTNLPLVGAGVEVYATAAETGERLGPPAHRKTIGADGRWGPFAADGAARYEFVITVPGYAVTHIYRSPFPRSSQVVSLRPERLAEADRSVGAVVAMSRPRGYFGVPRDRIALDGVSPPVGIPTGVAGVAEARIKLADGSARAVAGEFNGERIVGRTWSAAGNHVALLELTY